MPRTEVSLLRREAGGGREARSTRLLSRRGVRVLGTVSTSRKARIAKEAGAHEVLITDGHADLAAPLQDLTRGRSVDVVFDGVGRTTFAAGLKTLCPHGTYVLLGAASGPVDPVPPQELAANGSLFLTRPALIDHATEPAELLSRSRELFGWLRNGQVQTDIGARYPLARAADAHTALQERRTTGKVLLLPQ